MSDQNVGLVGADLDDLRIDRRGAALLDDAQGAHAHSHYDSLLHNAETRDLDRGVSLMTGDASRRCRCGSSCGPARGAVFAASSRAASLGRLGPWPAWRPV